MPRPETVPYEPCVSLFYVIDTCSGVDPGDHLSSLHSYSDADCVCRPAPNLIGYPSHHREDFEVFSRRLAIMAIP